MNESEEAEEIKTFTLNPYLLQGQQALSNCKPVSVGRKIHDTFASSNYPQQSAVIESSSLFYYSVEQLIYMIF